MRLKLTVALMAAMGMGLASGAQAASFFEDFNSPTLDPAWSVYQYTGTRHSYDGSPANHYSLTANPGSLRYYQDPMTHSGVYVYDYQIVSDPYYLYDPSLEISRPITGNRWIYETNIHVAFPSTQGVAITNWILFGPPGAGAQYVAFQYYGHMYAGNRLYFMFGRLNDNTYESLAIDGYGPADRDIGLRVVRDGGLIDLLYSLDGATWNLGKHLDFGDKLDGLNQRLSFDGHSWWSPAGSYADWDWVRFTSTSQSVPEPATLLLTLLGLGGLSLTRRRC